MLSGIRPTMQKLYTMNAYDVMLFALPTFLRIKGRAYP